MTDTAIAAELGCERSTLWRWKSEPEFAARVRALAEEMADGLLQRGLLVKRYRVQQLQDRHRRLLAVIEARASDRTMSTVPGGDTGLIVGTLKVTPSGRTFTDYQVDTALLRELRAIEEQAAREAGQWVEKHAQLSVLVDANDERLTAEQREVIRRALTGEGDGGA